MQLNKTIGPSNDDISFNKIISTKQRPMPEIIISEALKKSIEIISQYEYEIAANDKIEYKICSLCNNKFPTIQENKYSCEKCEKVFCIKHRNILEHHCNKLDPNKAKYLAAKNLINEKLRMRKIKGK